MPASKRPIEARDPGAATTLIAELSARFVNLPSERFDREIEDAQRRVCGCFELDNSTLWQAELGSPDVFLLTHVIRPAGSASPPLRIRAREQFPWCLEQLVAGKVVAVASVDRLPPEAARDREVWRQYGVKASLVLPLSVGGGPPMGILSFGVQRAERTWSDETVSRLQLLARVFANGLARKHADEALGESEKRFRMVFENSPLGIYRTSPDGRILLANPALLAMLRLRSFEELARQNLEAEGFHPHYPRRRFKEAIEHDGFVRGLESVWTRADGSTVVVRENAQVIRSADGKVIYYDGVVEDITERTQVAEALRREQSLLDHLFRTIPDQIYLKDRQSRFIRVNETMARRFGLRSADEAVGRSDFDFFSEEHARQAYADEQRIINTGEPLVGLEEKETWTDGRITWVITTKIPLKDTNGDITGIVGISRDITERKLAEMALRESEALYHSLVTHLPAGVFRKDRDGRYVFVNDQFCRLKGLTREEILGKAPQELADYERARDAAHPTGADFRQRTLVTQGTEHHELIMRTGRSIELEEVYPQSDGTVDYFHVVKSPVFGADGQVIGSQGIQFDITANRRAEQAQRESEARFRTLVEHAPVAVFVGTLREAESLLRFAYLNDAAADLFGAPAAAELLGQPVMDRIHPDSRDAVRRDMRELETKESVSSAELKYLRLDGTPVPADVTVANISFQGLKGAVVFARNIADRKKAETMIREQAALLDRASDAIYVTALDCSILYWNQAAARIYGWTAAEIAGCKTSELISTEELNAADLAAVVVQKGEWSGERIQKTKAGTRVDVFSRLTLVRDDQGRAHSILVINTDITEKKQLEARFLRAQRLESIGVLASGIAHDLNNVLAPITMAVPLLRDSVQDESARNIVRMIEASAKRGADIIRQVLTFARGTVGQRVSVEPKHLIMEMVRMAAETFPKNIQVVNQSAAGLWPVEADPTQLHQALMNLCVNARDAMPDGGKLTLAGDNLTIDEATAAQTPGVKAGPFVRLSVGDTGTGIPPEARERIFEPFFTTKGVGKGTGLGLSTVLGIVKGYGGFVRIDSHEGRGTIFDLFFPANPAPVAPVAPAAAHSAFPWPKSGGELVLLVDDEAAVREVARLALEESGYRVAVCASGEEAVRLFRISHADVHLVITDMLMPEMDGPTLVKALRMVAPQAPIVGITGVSDFETLSRLQTLGLSAMLAKPFTIGQLLTAVREALQRPIDPGQ